VVYIHDGLLSNHLKEHELSFVMSWMDLEDIMLSEISQAQTSTDCMVSLVLGIWKNGSHRSWELNSDYQTGKNKGEVESEKSGQ
jgi:hypothetical protein